MSDQSSNTKVGLFVLLGLIVMAASILAFGGKKAFLESYYELKTTFISTQGLARGSVISLAGVEVGNVTDIEFAADGNLIAVFKVQEKFKNRITPSATASIRTQGALGDKYIYINPGTAEGAPLEPGAFVHSETSPDIFELISGKANDITTVTDTIREVNALLHELNEKNRTGQLLDSFTGAGQNASMLMSDPNIKGSFSRLNSILTKIDTGTGTLGKLVNDTSLHERMIDILGEPTRNTYLKPILRDAIKQNERAQKKP